MDIFSIIKLNLLTFGVNLPALEGENKSKYDDRTLFWGSLHILDLSFKTINFRQTHICVISDCTSFSHFLGNFLLLLKDRSKFITFCIKFKVKKATFLPFKCIIAKLLAFIIKILKNSECSQG